MTPITEEELASLAACKSMDEWDALELQITRARGDHAPSDWYEKVYRSGLAARTLVRLGTFRPDIARAMGAVRTPSDALNRVLDCTEHGWGAWSAKYANTCPEPPDVFVVRPVFAEIAELLGCSPSELLRRMADVWDASAR